MWTNNNEEELTITLTKLIGSISGRVQSFKFPLTLPGEWIEYKIHGDLCTQMKLSLDDRRLITASKDGSLCFWEV